jgi:hypothetical protein
MNDFEDQVIYNRFSELAGQNGTMDVIFANLHYKGQSIRGACEAWADFGFGQLDLPFDNMEFGRVTMLMGRQDLMQGALPKVVDEHKHVCDDRAAIASMVTAFRNPPQRGGVNVVCGTNTWRLFSCSGLVTACVNCNKICGNTCPGDVTHAIMSPCMRCSQTRASYGIIRIAVTPKILYPEFREPFTVVTNRSHVDVTFNVSAPGRITFAAFREVDLQVVGAVARLTPQVIEQRGASVERYVGDVLNGSITVTGLNPDTDYRILAVTQDFAGHMMDVATSMALAHPVSTLCCPGLEWLATTHKFRKFDANNVATRPVFRYMLDTRPLSAAIFVAEMLPCAHKPDIFPSGIVVAPARFAFGALSPALEAAFSVRAETSGCAVLRVIGDAGSAAAANFVPLEMELEVMGSTFIPKPPQMESVRFAPDGRSLRIALTDDSNFGGWSSEIRDCSIIIEFPGNDGKCRWDDARSLEVVMGKHSTNLAGLGMDVTIKQYMLRHQLDVDNRGKGNDEQTLRILPPLEPVPPTAAISASSKIGKCDDIYLDPTATRGQAGRPWRSVVWTVTGEDHHHQANLTSIEQLLAAQSSSTIDGVYNVDNVLTVPNRLLERGEYTFALIVENFLGAKGAATKKVQVLLSGAVPRASIVGPERITSYRWQPVQVFAAAEMPACAQAWSKQLTYTWKVYKGLKFQPHLLSTSLDPRELKLAPFSLDALSRYTINVVVTAPHPPGSKTKEPSPSSSATMSIDVGTSDILAIISGGARRQVSANTEIVLDASSSVDMDSSGEVEGGIWSLQYRWGCLEVAPDYGAACPDASVLGVDLSEATLYLPPDVLTPFGKRTYLFDVTVSNFFNISSSAEVLVLVQVRESPEVSVGKTVAKYNPGERLVINGTVRVSPVLQAQGRVWAGWSSEQLSAADLREAAVAGAVMELPEVFDSAPVQLVLARGMLQPGVRYTFRLLAAVGLGEAGVSDGEGDSFAEVSVVMNRPPSGGGLVVTPSFGYSMNTTFRFVSASWSDDVEDYPLRYTFAYYTLTALEQSTVKTRSKQPYAASYFSEGLERLNRQVSCVVHVTDLYEGTTMAEAADKVVVHRNPDVGAVRAAAEQELSDATEVFDSERVMQIVSASVSSLNNAVCTGAPDCQSLGRSACSRTSNTCGTCLAGLQGVDGDANTPCLDMADAERRRLVGGLPGDSCATSTDCFSGMCQNHGGTNDVDMKCARAYKQCPGDSTVCSLRGLCQAFDRYDIPLPLSFKCPIEDPSCAVRCVCFDSSFGRDCSLSQVEFESDRSTRAVLVRGLYDTLTIQEVTEEVVVSRVTMISGVLEDKTLASAQVVSDATAVLLSTLAALPSVAARDASFNKYVQAFSRVLEASDGFAHMAEVLQGVQALGRERLALLAQGEVSPVISTPTVRLGVQVRAVADFEQGGDSVRTPVSTMEDLLGTHTASVHIRATTGMPTDQLGIVLLDLSRLNPAVSNSSQLVVDVASLSGSQAISSLDVTVINNVALSYTAQQLTNGSVLCRDLGDGAQPYNETIVCALSGEHQLYCAGTDRGWHDYVCPSSRIVPTCQNWTVDSGVGNIAYDPRMQVVEYSQEETTCRVDAAAHNGTERVSLPATSAFKMLYSTFHSSYIRMSPPDEQYDDTVLYSTAAVVACFLVMIGGAHVMYMLRWLQRTVFGGDANAKDDAKLERSMAAFFSEAMPKKWIHVTRLGRLFSGLEMECLDAPSEERPRMIARVRFKRDCAEYMNFAGKIICLAFVCTMVIWTHHADDGTCQAQDTQSECCDGYAEEGYCTNAHAPLTTQLLVFGNCVWVPEENYCVKRELPPNDIQTLFVLATIVQVLALPLEVVLEMLVVAYYRAQKIVTIRGEADHMLTKKQKNKKGAKRNPYEVSKTSLLKEGEEEKDAAEEYAKWESECGVTRWVSVLRSARLTKMKLEMDLVGAEEELKTMIAVCNEDSWHPDTPYVFADGPLEDTSLAQAEVRIRLSNLTSYGLGHPRRAALMMHYGFRESGIPVVESLLLHRGKAGEIIRDLSHAKSRGLRSIILLRHFLASWFTGYQADLARFYLIDPILLNRRGQSSAKSSLYLMLLILYQAGMLVVMLVVGVGPGILDGSTVPGDGGMGTIGSRLWLSALVVSVLELYVVAIPLFQWICITLVSNLVGSKLQRISDMLRRRGKIILLRGSGIMHNYSALVHHFNPACRAARAFPELSISRLLLTLNDWDLPDPRRSSLDDMLALLVMPIQLFLTLYMRIPISLRMLMSRLVFIVVANLLLFEVFAAYGMMALYACGGVYVLGVIYVTFLRDFVKEREWTFLTGVFAWLHRWVEEARMKRAAARAALKVAVTVDNDPDALLDATLDGMGLKAKPLASDDDKQQKEKHKLEVEEEDETNAFSEFDIPEARRMPDPDALPAPTLEVALEDTMLIGDMNKVNTTRLPPIRRTPVASAAAPINSSRRTRSGPLSDMSGEDTGSDIDDAVDEWRTRRRIKSQQRSMASSRGQPSMRPQNQSRRGRGGASDVRHSRGSDLDPYDSDRESGDRSDDYRPVRRRPGSTSRGTHSRTRARDTDDRNLRPYTGSPDPSLRKTQRHNDRSRGRAGKGRDAERDREEYRPMSSSRERIRHRIRDRDSDADYKHHNRSSGDDRRHHRDRPQSTSRRRGGKRERDGNGNGNGRLLTGNSRQQEHQHHQHHQHDITSSPQRKRRPHGGRDRDRDRDMDRDRGRDRDRDRGRDRDRDRVRVRVRVG